MNGQPNPENGTETPEPSESSEPEEDEPEDKMEVATPTPSVTETPEESMEFKILTETKRIPMRAAAKALERRRAIRCYGRFLKCCLFSYCLSP